MVATKLDLAELDEWLDNELKGYKDLSKIPSYRKIFAELKGYNPYRGWIPVMFEDPETQRILNERPIGQEISGIEDLLNDRKALYAIPLNPEARNAVLSSLEVQPAELMSFTSRAAIVGLLDAVRNIILEWSLKLEKSGILGEDLSFSEEDKRKAHSKETTYQINNVENFIGSVSASENAMMVVSQKNFKTNKDLIELLKQLNAMDDGQIPLNGTELVQYKKVMTDLNGEVETPIPDRGRIGSLLVSLKRIFEGAGGSVLAQGVVAVISKILAG